MQTKIYKQSILKEIQDISSIKVITTTYDFLLNTDYINIDGKPKEKLIFLKYDDFSLCIDSFFINLYNYVTPLCPTASRNYIIDLFKFAPYTIKEVEKIKSVPSDIKIEYDILENKNHVQNYAVILKMNEIKKFYKDKYIFIYNKVRDNYGAKLQQENDIFLCPYCQRNYVNVIQKDKLTIKPDLDHFYPKGKYPFMSATLENLVPSCQVCNSRLKGEVDFYKIPHIHPLQPSGNIFKKIKFLYLGKKNIYIKRKPPLTDEEQKYLETFKIEEIYSTHTEILDEILEKNKRYNYVKKNHILKTCPSIGIRTIKELVFHDYIHIDKKKEPMYALKKSLFEKIVK